MGGQIKEVRESENRERESNTQVSMLSITVLSTASPPVGKLICVNVL